MRVLEIFILISELSLLGILWFKTPGKSKIFKLLFSIPLLLFLLHAFIEGVRWQMVPAYGMAVILSLTGLIYHSWHLHKYLKIFLSFLAVLLIILSALLGYLLPVFHLPKPSGQFTVGTTYLHFQDKTRPEIITEDTTDFRELMVRVWYPAEPGKQATFPYMHPELSKILAETRGFPGFVLSHFNLIKTNALEDASVVQGKNSFPFIIFSHGYMSHSSMYTFILETLASHGYVIVSIDYTYETPLSIFPYDDLKFYNQEYTDVWEEASWDSVQASIEAFRANQDVAMKRRQVKKYLTHVPYTQHVDHWVEDVNFVIDQLQSKNQLSDKSLFNKIDLDKIGVMGHSVGGATSAVACATDRRIKAGINLDGSQWGSLMDTLITQPFMWITAEKDPVASSLDIDAFIYKNTTVKDFYHLRIAHATHANFYDLSLWANHPSITQTGTIDSHKMITIVNNCTLAFFDKYLKKKPIEMNDLTEHFAELNLITE